MTWHPLSPWCSPSPKIQGKVNKIPQNELPHVKICLSFEYSFSFLSIFVKYIYCITCKSSKKYILAFNFNSSKLVEHINIQCLHETIRLLLEPNKKNNSSQACISINCMSDVSERDFYRFYENSTFQYWWIGNLQTLISNNSIS